MHTHIVHVYCSIVTMHSGAVHIISIILVTKYIFQVYLEINTV